jgi:hypothetical protein
LAVTTPSCPRRAVATQPQPAEERHRARDRDRDGQAAEQDVGEQQQRAVHRQRQQEHAGEQQRGEVHVALEAVDPLEALLERHGEQEAEQDLHARHDDAQLVEQLQQLPVEPLALVLVLARGELGRIVVVDVGHRVRCSRADAMSCPGQAACGTAIRSRSC